MRIDMEQVFLRIEARRARRRAHYRGERCPEGVLAILAKDTDDLEQWDGLLYKQWRERHGLVREDLLSEVVILEDIAAENRGREDHTNTSFNAGVGG